MILFVDLGTFYAIAGSPFHGQAPRIMSKNTSRFSHGERLDLFDRDLVRMIFGAQPDQLAMRNSQHKARAVYYERVHRHEGTDAAHLWGAFYGAMAIRCHNYGIPIYGVPVQEIKRHATGLVNATKAQMIAAAKLNGWEPHVMDGTPGGNDNAADALWGLALCEKSGAIFHAGTKAAQNRAAERALEKRATGGTRKAKQ